MCPKTPSLRRIGPSGLVAVSSRNNFSLAEKNSLLNLRIPAQLGVNAALNKYLLIILVVKQRINIKNYIDHLKRNEEYEALS